MDKNIHVIEALSIGDNTGIIAIPYAKCETEANVALKTVAPVNGFVLEPGAQIRIKFAETNTSTDAISLNVSNTGAKPIYHLGSPVSGSILTANKVFDLLYNSDEQWEIINVDTDTVYIHDTYTEYVNGLYKITVEGEGHVSAATAVTKDDIMNLGIPGQDNDTKVTAVGNHYTPTADSTKTLSVDASSTTSATWGSTNLVTGVNIQRDAAGHVTGVTVDSIQMPDNPNTLDGNDNQMVKVNVPDGTDVEFDKNDVVEFVAGSNIIIEGNKEKKTITISADVPTAIETLTDNEVKLSSELKTYYNVGKITNASGTNPVTIGTTGQTLRKVFENLFSMDEVQPTITSYPSVSCTLTNDDASDERDTVIKSASYRITFNDGAYTNASTTGVTMTSYSFSSGTASSSKDVAGTLTFASDYKVGTSSAVSPTLTAEYSDGSTAKTNLGNDSYPVVKITADSTTCNPTFSKIAVDYPYFISDSAATIDELSGKTFSKKSINLTTTTGVSCNYNKDAYVWIFTRKGDTETQPSKTIEAYSEQFSTWGTYLEGTESKGTIKFNKETGVEDTFFAYRTKVTSLASGTVKFRLI